MLNLNRFAHLLAIPAVLGLPTIAHASNPITVVVGPTLQAAAVAVPVPTMTENLLIALGLLLMVFAFRALRNRQGAQKLLSLLLLGGGVAIAGLGVERTMAVDAGGTVTAEGSPCTTSGPLPVYYPEGGEWTLENTCPNDITIISITGGGCTPGGTYSCAVDDVLEPAGTCTLPNACTFIPD